jgi:outer membrane lipoprotein-sorting protein
MNCAECRDNLVACAEGLLDREESLQCHAHLESCANCRQDYRDITRLQQELIIRGQAAAEVAVVEPVMQRVLREREIPERITIMSRLLKYRWGFGLSAAASVAAAIVLFAIFAPAKLQAKAAEVLAKGAQAAARLTSIHLRGQLRTLPQDNFSYINADCPFSTIELWKQFDPDLKWRVEKPLRVIVMDGKSTVMLIKSGNVGVKLPQRTTSAFDTDWLHRIANLSNALTNELNNALAKGWKLSVADETGADGKTKSVVTIVATSGLPDNDYGKNAFMENADTRRVYHFDAESGLLEAVQVYMIRPAGEVQIFDLSQIDYNQAMAADTWALELPADVSWAQTPDTLPKLPDNEKYSSITAEQAARAFFEACGREDWDEAGKFMSPINEQLKRYLGGVQIVSLGDAFTSKSYGWKFVPYEIKLRPQEFTVRVSNDNPAHRYVLTGICDTDLKVQQDLTWTTPPAILPDNDTYAKMSPVEVVKACVDAWAKFDWQEMRKFDRESDVAEDEAKVAEQQKRGADVHSIFPTIEVGDAVWSPEQSTWFVKCRAFQVKKWNMAVRQDNPAKRWQVDGGI